MAGIFVGVAVAEIGLFLWLGQVRGPAPTPVVEPPPFEVVLYDPPPPISAEPRRPRRAAAPRCAIRHSHAAPSAQGTPPRSSRPACQGAGACARRRDRTVAVAATRLRPGRAGDRQRIRRRLWVRPGQRLDRTASGHRSHHRPDLRQPPTGRPQSFRSGRTVLRNSPGQPVGRLPRCSRDAPGLGFGAAGLQVSGYFRFQPPTEDGRPVDGQRVTVGIDFGRLPNRG